MLPKLDVLGSVEAAWPAIHTFCSQDSWKGRLECCSCLCRCSVQDRDKFLEEIDNMQSASTVGNNNVGYICNTETQKNVTTSQMTLVQEVL